MKYYLFIFAFLTCQGHAEIYKWVDKNGITHFGSQKPNQVKNSEVEIIQSSDKKEPSPEVSEIADSFTKEAMKDHGNTAQLDCNSAVTNAKEGIDDMLSAGEKNFKAGYMSSEDFTKTSNALSQLKSMVSKRECEASSGEKRDFYLCVSNSYNLVAMCGKKYKYGG